MSDVIRDCPTDMAPDPAELDFLPIDPFAARRDVASRVAGLGGEHPSDDPAYVFQSLDLYPVLGPVRFTLHFHQLAASAGTLVVTIRAISAYPHTAAMVVKTVAVDMAGIAAADGIFHVTLTSRRNMIYTIGGSIEDDTDARALALSLSLDPRKRDAPMQGNARAKVPVTMPAITPVERLLYRPELATMRPSLLARPVSQPMTEAQRCEPLVSAWNDVLHRPGGTDTERWEDAFILQALHYYGIATDSGTALGIGGLRRSLPSYLADRGCTILAAATHRDDLPEGDPGLALERLLDDDLCATGRFFEAVHLTMFEDLVIPAPLTGFDFLWSTDVPAGPGMRARFPQMLRDSLACLRPGGLAIHMIRYSGGFGRPEDSMSSSYGRAEIERMALSLVADGQEVAQLKFDLPDKPGDRQVPFALVARRMR